MPLTIDLPPELERQLRAEAARAGRAPEELARDLIEERLGPTTAPPQPNEGLVALLRQWREAPIDLEEVEGYPETTERLRLREVQID